MYASVKSPSWPFRGTERTCRTSPLLTTFVSIEPLLRAALVPVLGRILVSVPIVLATLRRDGFHFDQRKVAIAVLTRCLFSCQLSPAVSSGVRKASWRIPESLKPDLRALPIPRRCSGDALSCVVLLLHQDRFWYSTVPNGIANP
jgi:hypothetical protein